MNYKTEYVEQVVHAGKWLHYKHLQFKVKGKEVNWEYVERPPHINRGGVEIIPIIRYKEQPPQIIVIANFRVPLKHYCLEFPAGIVDPEGTIEENAIREMKEETGYTCTLTECPRQRLFYDPWKSNEHGQLLMVSIDGDAPENINPIQQLEADENIKVYKLPYGKELHNHIQQLVKDNNYEMSGLLWGFALGLSMQI